ncbi:MAG: alpha/beta hydrolase [Thermocrispum sp.]
MHADDILRMIDDLGVPSVDLFGSSGGAINGLALVAKHPERVRVFVAHEPPLASVLPDREPLLAACRDIHETYRRDGMGPAMAKFIALTSHTGPLPADWVDRPAPAPSAFGMPTEDDGSRDDPLLGPAMLRVPSYQPDFAALAAASTRIVPAAGKESAGQMAARAPVVIAERLGTDLVTFPSHHGGFMGGESGMQGEPAAFAEKLREVLDAG